MRTCRHKRGNKFGNALLKSADELVTTLESTYYIQSPHAVNGKHCGLIVTVQDFRISNSNWSPSRGHCAVFLVACNAGVISERNTER